MRLGIDDRTIRRTLASLTLGAVLLRLLTFLGRGDYIAFDEGWYLLLGQSLWSGEGYRLTGLRHITLSPLFPVLAGGMGRLLGDPVWGGRIVAAITSGLLVIPCWSIFSRLAGRRTALLACTIVALTPSLAPFVAPELVGWDLWVGAEPVYHLFLYSGIALTLRAVERQRWGDWVLAGGALALAYLARPEAVVITGLLGLLVVALVLIRRTPKRILGPVVVGLTFVLVASPYLFFLRDATGRWTLTGRAVQVRTAGGERPGASTVIERMLWQGSHGAYVRVLFALDPSGTRMASTYWGVPEETEMPAAPSPASGDVAPGNPSEDDLPREESALPAVDPGATPVAVPAADSGATAVASPAARDRFILYSRALGLVVPAVLIPFVLIGLLAPRRRYQVAELLFVAPLVVASLSIARIVAIDPRTQLFLVPALAYYAARGGRFLGVVFDARISRGAIRKGLAPALVVLIIVTTLATEGVQRLYLSRSIETTHQFVAAENRRAGEELRRIVPEGSTIMSWHPAVALHAQREWRVLPLAPLPAVIRYAAALGSEYVVLSAYNPSPFPVEETQRPYLLVRTPPDVASVKHLRIELVELGNGIAVSKLVPE